MELLIVEGDEVSAIALSAMLTRLGHKVRVARDGSDGWAAIQERPVPIAILDWMMPEMSGIELCLKIKASPRLEKTLVIMLTAKQTREDRVEALRAGVDVFLTKPLKKDDLIARLQIAERLMELDKLSAVV